MLYLPAAWVRAALADGPAGDPAFRETLSDDPRLALAIARACQAMTQAEGRLLREAALDAVLDGLRPHLGQLARAGAEPDLPVARRARERLRDCLGQDIGADALARAAGADNRFQLARAFRASYGTAPHAYLVRLRLVEARRRLGRGEAPASVAAACGFADQSHLGRWFRRAFGLTPAAYRACCTGVPDAEGRRSA